MLSNSSQVRRSFSRIWLIAAIVLMLFAARSGGALPSISGQQMDAPSRAAIGTPQYAGDESGCDLYHD